MNIRWPIYIVLFAATAALGDASDEVRCREIAFSQSVERQNAAAFLTFIDADARFISGEVNRGPAAIATAWSTFFTADGPRIKWRPQFIEVLDDGRLALSRGPYRMIVTDEAGQQTEHWGTYNSVWRLQSNGKWKVVFDAGSPAATPPSDKVKALLDQANTCSDSKV